MSKLEYSKEDIIEMQDDITWWTNRFKAVERDNKELHQRIDKANEILSNILVVKRSDGNYGPVKNTTKKEVYKTICMLNEILDTSSYERNEMLKILGDKE